jgi:hypothetical protein
MPDESPLTLHEVGQLRTDIANVEAGFEFIMEQVARLRKELWRAGLLGMLGRAAAAILIEALSPSCL